MDVFVNKKDKVQDNSGTLNLPGGSVEVCQVHPNWMIGPEETPRPECDHRPLTQTGLGSSDKLTFRINKGQARLEGRGGVHYS